MVSKYARRGGRANLKKIQNPTYRVLATDGLPKSTRDMIDHKLKGVETGVQAKALAVKEEDFSYKVLDQLGKVGVVRYKGIEVAVFFDRQVVSVTSEECDPTPRNKVVDKPEESWVRFELLHVKAASDRNPFFKATSKKMEASIQELEGLQKQKDMELELLRQTNIELTTQVSEQGDTLKAQRAYIQRLRLELATLKAPPKPIVKKKTEKLAPSKKKKKGKKGKK